MPGPYETTIERGNRWPENRRMHVMIYPNRPAERAACEPGATVPTAVRNGADQLFDADAISYYRLARFPAERDEFRYPRVGRGDIKTDFVDYLRGTTEEFSDQSWCANGDCRDLLAYRGAHLLVHGYGFGVHRAGAQPVDCEYNGGSGFSSGVAAWTGAEDGSETGLVRNSAIHETVHVFVRAEADAVQPLICNANDDGKKSAYEEHTLGALTPEGAVTPLLTYHVDEHAGCGHPPRTWNGTYTQAMTDRTKEAVRRTGLNQCRPQPGVPGRTDESA